MANFNPYAENTTAWLSTTASQIFFMQLGFMCYEVGFVKQVWAHSIILKNIEATFVGVLVYLAFGYTLSESPHTFYGIISIPTNPLLFGVQPEVHDQVLISAFFASTSATIISGAVLQRMKNKAYVYWCSLTVLINFSFVSHWIWHQNGWLLELGFVDGAGSLVVHATAGMASLIAIWRLGPRKGVVNADEITLKRVESASRPIIHAMGAFFLWYGWYAFNVASPIAGSKGIGDAIGTTALVTVISPVCAACGAFILMYFEFASLSFEDLLNCLLAGLVAITGPCHSCNPLESAVIGFIASVVYFVSAYVVRYKWHIDDPMQITSIHLCCGIFSCFAEGIVANDVYGTPGLIYGGFKHFGIQIFGIIVVCLFNFIVCLFLYELLLKRVLFRGREMKVSVLDIYLGTQIFVQDYALALEEVLECQTNKGKRMLWQFHKYVHSRFASEQLDFLIVVQILNNYLAAKNRKKSHVKIAKYIIQIIDTYVEEDGVKCINVSGTQRCILLRIKSQILFELELELEVDIGRDGKEEEREEEDIKTPSDPRRSVSLIRYRAGYNKSGMDITTENIFKTCYISVWKIILPLFTQFLLQEFRREKKHKFAVKIPFILKDDWLLEWDAEIQKENESMELADKVPQITDLTGSFLKKEKYSTRVQLQHVTVAVDGDKSDYSPIVLESDINTASIVIE